MGMSGTDTLCSSRVTDEQFKSLLRDLYLLPNCSVGGPLHIVTDDENVTDSDLDFVEKEARGLKHWAYEDLPDKDRTLIVESSLMIIAALRAVDETERERLVRLRWWT